MAPDSDGCIFLQEVFSLKTPKRVWRAPTLIGNRLGETIEFPSEKKEANSAITVVSGRYRQFTR